MEATPSLGWDALLQGVVSLAVLLAAISGILVRTRDRATAYWLMGWAALLGTGALLLVADALYPPARFVAYMLDATVGPLMLLGALQLSDRRPAYLWPLLAGLVTGALRVGLDVAGMTEFDALHSAIVAPAFLVAAAWVVMRTAGNVEFRATIVALFAVYVGVEFYDAFRDFVNRQNTLQWQLMIGVCVPLSAFQVGSRLLGIAAEKELARAAHDEIQHERELERWRFDALFDHVHDLVAEISEDTRILYVNRRAKDLLGIEPEDLIGRYGIDFVPAELRARSAEAFRERVKARTIMGPEVVEVPHPDGGTRFLEYSMSDYRFPHETRLLVVVRDVTARAESERRLEEQRRDLEVRFEERSEELRASLTQLRDQERLVAVGTLASGIAHQINNPVGAISAAAEFGLMSGGREDTDQIRVEALERIVEEASRAGRIVKNILRFAVHGDTNKWDEDLRTVVTRSVELVRGYVEEREGTLVVRPCDEPAPVRMSPIEIEQVVVNLVHNAAESRSAGVEIEVELFREGEEIVLEVGDNGRGIAGEIRDQIFDPFFTTRLREGGSGLGLAVVHGIVADHGGRIEIESELARGTKVRVRLPLVSKTAALGNVGAKEAGDEMPQGAAPRD